MPSLALMLQDALPCIPFWELQTAITSQPLRFHATSCETHHGAI